MKHTIRLWWLVACAATAQVLLGAKPGEPGGPGEYRDFRVIKAYFAQDGEYTFRAFAIEWDGQEVVARDVGSLIKARSDDTINVLVSRGLPRPNQRSGLILFLARPEKKPPGGKFHATPADPSVVVQLKVNKVYVLNGGDYAFRAYEMEWKGQDVIVFDPGANTTHEVGQTVSVMISKRLYENHNKIQGCLDFTLTSLRRTPKLKTM